MHKLCMVVDPDKQEELSAAGFVIKRFCQAGLSCSSTNMIGGFTLCVLLLYAVFVNFCGRKEEALYHL